MKLVCSLIYFQLYRVELCIIKGKNNDSRYLSAGKEMEDQVENLNKNVTSQNISLIYMLGIVYETLCGINEKNSDSRDRAAGKERKES